MSRDRYYNPGDHYVIDDIKGIKRRYSESRLQWDGLLTEGASWSARNEQDLVTGVYDNQSVELARPRQKDQFVILATIATAPVPAGSSYVIVESTVGFAPGNVVQIMLDSGVPFQTVIEDTSGGMLSWSGNRLPSSVGLLYGDPIENQVLRVAIGNPTVPYLMELESTDGNWLFEDSSVIEWG